VRLSHFHIKFGVVPSNGWDTIGSVLHRTIDQLLGRIRVQPYIGVGLVDVNVNYLVTLVTKSLPRRNHRTTRGTPLGGVDDEDVGSSLGDSSDFDVGGGDTEIVFNHFTRIGYEVRSLTLSDLSERQSKYNRKYGIRMVHVVLLLIDRK